MIETSNFGLFDLDALERLHRSSLRDWDALDLLSAGGQCEETPKAQQEVVDELEPEDMDAIRVDWFKSADECRSSVDA
ncbi:hypothetical protein ABIA32_006645 [Streptacidiphilus sp. MAP12-20]|uniref:hypothetical protein n=1 Tax=Streptacidiphilus sp. MAP12-20 TaxID=3156299 RepID=UPI0035162A6E